MRWVLLTAVVLLGAALAWWLSAGAEPVPQTPPVAASSPVPAAPTDETHEPPAPVPDTSAPPADVPAVDAGRTLVEVAVEVFGADGHAPGAAISFHEELASQPPRRWSTRSPPW